MGTNLDLSALLANAQTTYESRGAEILTETLPGPWSLYTLKIDVSDSGIWQNDFVANIPVMRQWVGARVDKTLRGYTQSLEAVAYEATLPIARNVLRRDKSGAVGRAIDAFLRKGAATHDKFASEALDSNSSAGPTGYDAVALFSTAHPHVNSGSGHSNLSAGTNLSHANYGAARAVFMTRVDEQGEPMGPFRVTHMRIHPTLLQRAKEILDTDRIIKYTDISANEATSGVQNATAVDNVFKGDAMIIEDHRIATADQYEWTLFDLSRPEKPMVLIEERAPEQISQLDMEDPRRFTNDEFVFGLEADFKVGAGFWPLAYRATGTA